MTATCTGCSTSCAQRQQPLEGQLGHSAALQSVDSCIDQENAHARHSPSSSEETRLRLTDYPAAPHPKAMPHLLIAVGDSLVPELCLTFWLLLATASFQSLLSLSWRAAG